ncbi:MAG: 3-deoxy-8-phosphooctulonate synthase [Candidatus Omnitrophota bacterium]
MIHNIRIKDINIGQGNPLVLIAGPCVIESQAHSMFMAKSLKKIAAEVGIPFIFKASFDKANRTSLESYRGPGIRKGLKILKKIKEAFEIPILSDVHCKEELKHLGEILDIIQIPAFLCRQTDLLIAAAKTKKVVNIKKGQFLAPWDMKEIINKVEANANKQILITERGVSFGYNNLVSDLRSLSVIRSLGYPVIYDATHSIQLPGGQGRCSGGNGEYVIPLSRAAVAFGCDGLFLEVHDNPKKALCDGPNMINLTQLEGLLIQVKKIERALA